MPRFSSREEYESWKSSAASPVPAPGSEAERPPSAPAPVKQKQTLKQAFSDLPAWAWVFVVACLALPVVNLGGAIPGALGFGGAAGCANVAKKTDWEGAPRVLVCALITGGVWTLFFAFAVAVVALRK
jgi:hypothetical protein